LTPPKAPSDFAADLPPLRERPEIEASFRYARRCLACRDCGCILRFLEVHRLRPARRRRPEAAIESAWRPCAPLHSLWNPSASRFEHLRCAVDARFLLLRESTLIPQSVKRPMVGCRERTSGFARAACLPALIHVAEVLRDAGRQVSICASFLRSLRAESKGPYRRKFGQPISFRPAGTSSVPLPFASTSVDKLKSGAEAGKRFLRAAKLTTANLKHGPPR
jgi:hypothetical protein